MRVTLNQTEVFKAIADFVRSKWKLDEATTVDISLTAGRSPKGYTADVEITYPEEASNITTRVVDAEVTDVADQAEPAATEVAAEPSDATGAEAGVESSQNIFG